jgi:predicted O-methyltransferase YrrM
MSLSGYLRRPAARRRAKRGIVPERPWIVPAAVGWLGRRARRHWRVLELGSGRSTLWYARRTASVLSFEDNLWWVARSREMLDEAGIGNAEIRELPVEQFVAAVGALPDESFDLIVIDFLESPEAERVDAVRVARDKVRPGGYLLLDDSDRPGYAPAWELLHAWRERRFSGIKDEWPEACETTIFRRPRAPSRESPPSG